MSAKLSTLDRRRFLRGLGGFALALPVFETFTLGAQAGAAIEQEAFRRLLHARRRAHAPQERSLLQGLELVPPRQRE